MGDHYPMQIAGDISGQTITLSWIRPPGTSKFHVTIDKCEAQTDCYNIFTRNSKDNFLSWTDEKLQQCTVYNIRLVAQTNKSLPVVRDEVMMEKNFGECFFSPNAILIIGFTILALLVMVAIGMGVYFHRRHPLYRLTRVRSQLYSRLYSHERYQLPVKRDQFVQLVNRELSEKEPFAQEFNRLERISFDTIQRKTTIAELPSNKRRNRYTDIVPFNATRVCINPPYMIDGDTHPSDYINASFITDVIRGTNRKYIAAQGPGQDTTPAFWEMIWQYDIRVVMMLTAVIERSGVRCNNYWPDTIGELRKHNQLAIQLFDVAEAPNYVVRKFDLSNTSTNTNREIVHIQYTNWPDRSTPESPLELIQLVELSRVLYGQYNNKHTPDTPSPLLVHCSAGVGRTGTFICVDQLMRSIESQLSTEIDVFHTIYQIRRDRMYMVQSRAQYEFVYRCAAAYLEKVQQRTERLSGSSQEFSPGSNNLRIDSPKHNGGLIV